MTNSGNISQRPSTPTYHRREDNPDHINREAPHVYFRCIADSVLEYSGIIELLLTILQHSTIGHLNPLGNMDSNDVYKQVQDHYGSLARAEKPSCSVVIAQAFGYTEEELNSIPRDANLGLSCGNPLAIASLREASFIDSQLVQT